MNSIDRLHLKDNQLLTQLIQSHLSFIIDLNFDINSKEQTIGKKRSLQTPSDTIFGSPLTQEGICCVNQLIEFITNDKNILNEGIFRKSGSTVRQMELKELISMGVTVDLYANRFTVHDCCSVLKRFISELPEPLMTESKYPFLKKISQLCDTITSPTKTSKKLTAIQLILLLLPAPNRQLIHELLSLFDKVISNVEQNKMTSISLATIFAPHLFCPRSFSAIELQQHLDLFTQTLIFMIDNSEFVCLPPKQLILDVDKQLELIENNKSESTTSLAAVNTGHQFCVQNNNTSDDFTSAQVAQLYAYIQSMPNSGTPMKKKWIKRFNRENGKGTPLLKQKNFDNSNKKLKTSIGSVLKAGQQFLFGTNSDSEIAKQKLSKNLFTSPLSCCSEKSSPTPTKLNHQMYNKTDNCQPNPESCVTPLSASIENANKKIRLSVRKVGNREPIIM
ncbi:rho GTPase-activating protein 19-like [Oppia nitens]|uniref:rho GTPase-activating protein 19-like n=1 Tax=Oppia nitens TaxID=1686743 RepID=UPI0023DA4CA2|nr:rho GTPase-activating protein 19-like [Oppia nitens]